MKITVLQHTPNEGLGMIRDYAHLHKHELYVYHPYQFGNSCLWGFYDKDNSGCISPRQETQGASVRPLQ